MLNNEKLLMLVLEYLDKHPTVKECGGEYIYQDDEAQIDALELVADIFEQCF